MKAHNLPFRVSDLDELVWVPGTFRHEPSMAFGVVEKRNSGGAWLPLDERDSLCIKPPQSMSCKGLKVLILYFE